MSKSPWDELDATLAALSNRPWSGAAWRFHGCRYAATSVGGALRISGRYHRGLDFYPEAETWPALYLTLAPHIAIAERLRHTSPETFVKITTQCLSELWVDLRAVLDCCAAIDPDRLTPAVPGLVLADLCSGDFAPTQAIASVARRQGAEGLLVPSCTALRGGNLVLFPDLLQPDSSIRVVVTEVPSLGTTP